MYPVIHVSDDASDLPEQLGTKRKFWYRDDKNGLCLFKEGRPNTGENWAEKVCCELCELLGIPHARYDFAEWRNCKGVVSPTFVPNEGRLILGNELLAKLVKDYEHTRRFDVRQHTVQVVMAILRVPLLMKVPKTILKGQPPVKAPITVMIPPSRQVAKSVIRPVSIGMPLDYKPPDELTKVADVFVGYLMLDALVGNQDRHHENWGLVLSNHRITLAPTFDHASSLGRNELDAARMERLTSRDQGRSVEKYVERAKSAFYGRLSDEKPLTTLAAFQEAARISPGASLYWLRRLQMTARADYGAIFNNIPYSEISELARDFALKMLEINRGRLLQNLKTVTTL